MLFKNIYVHLTLLDEANDIFENINEKHLEYNFMMEHIKTL